VDYYGLIKYKKALKNRAIKTILDDNGYLFGGGGGN
tara:strand:+ start:402 stop:509 length:108 start_codon:yes stop_codon:yes gene_type:complete